MIANHSSTKLKTVKFKFAKHCNPDYKNAHDILNFSYSEPLKGIDDLFVDGTRTDVTPNVAIALKKKVMAAITTQAFPTNDPGLVQILFGQCPMYAQVDGDRQPIRNDSDFKTIIDHAIEESTNKITIFLNINSLHFKEKFIPEKLEDISTTPFPTSSDTRRMTNLSTACFTILREIQGDFKGMAQTTTSGETRRKLMDISASTATSTSTVPTDTSAGAMDEIDHVTDESIIETFNSNISVKANAGSVVQDTVTDMSGDEGLRYKLMQSPENIDPVSIDRYLSKELLNLGLKDRNAIDEEIHGISSLAPEESELFLVEALLQLSKRLDELPIPSKLAYVESQKYPETYVNTRDFRLRFLRCELFDSKKAAVRLVKFLSFASHLFGPEVLKRPIRLTDFNRDEEKLLRSGYVQVFPFRDSSGRPILARVGDFGFQQLSVTSRNKVGLYFNYALSADAENQRKGVTKLFWMGSHDHKPSPVHFEWENIVYSKRLQESSPLRLCASHCCLPDKPYFHMLRLAYGIALGANRSRIKFHIGEEVELRYTLKTYGIPVDLIPVTNTGNIKTTYLKQWLRVQKIFDTSTDPETSSSIIQCPRSTDVIFRGGTSLMSHPGSSMFHSIIELALEEHSAASKTEKISIVKTIISKVHEQGRFLQWDNRGWWTELTSQSEIHTKVAEKMRRVTLVGKAMTRNRNQQQQLSRSSTNIFENQDNRKRRKVSRDDSDSSRGSIESCCLNGW